MRPLNLFPDPFRLLLVLCLAMLGLSAPALCFAASPFEPPAAFEPDIHFWTRIYTEVGTDGGLIHDDRALDVVYEIMRFPADLTPAERSRRVTAAKEKYSAILDALTAGRADDTSETRRVRELWVQHNRRYPQSWSISGASERVRFQLGQANRFREGLVRAGAYEAHIAETLANMGLPPELAALPHVESSFDPTAYSHAGAAGLWQFIRSTGRRYMRVDEDVDERMDPHHSTVAAARFLKFNYDLLGSWPLALTAYNHGPAGMRRAKEKTGTDDMVYIARNYQSRTFGFASRNYYVAFLAALEVDRNVEQYFGALQRHSEIRTRSFTLPAYVPVNVLVQRFGIDKDMLRRLNPSLTRAIWQGERYVPRGFELRLPEERIQGDPDAVLAALGPGERFNGQKQAPYYLVRRGDSLSAIAAKHGTSVSSLLRANGMRNAQSLRAGQRLRIPGAVIEKPVVVAAVPKPAPAPEPAPVTPPKPAPAPEPVPVPQPKPAPAPKPVPPKPAPVPSRPAPPVVAQVEPPPSATSADLEEAAQEIAREADIARTQNAEPVSESQAEAFGPQLVPGAQSPVSADPSDYMVASDLTIEVQAGETLGHYAEWLDLRATNLRELNRLKFNQPVIIGQRLRIEFTGVSVEEFERRRRAWHQALQDVFFLDNRIVGTEIHVIRRGESIWSIARKYPKVPLWLLRQHNPDVNFTDLKPKTPLVLPQVEAVAADTPNS